MRKYFSIFILAVFVTSAFGQFAPAAGVPSSTAIHKDDVSFKGWAKTCKVTRGFINISDTTKTFTQAQVTSNRSFFGTEEMATGKPGGPLDCISLGDGGSAVLTFDFPIRNGEGADFAVFENGIKEQEPPFQYFLELAFVEVSTDGKRFVRFPATSNVPVNEQINSFGQINPTLIHNFAGKYVANYGTPFDLADVADSAGINTDSIRFIRLIDVVGNIDPKFARYDAQNKIVNDPFPTEFWTGGFDLDAVGAIHLNGITATQEKVYSNYYKVFPNPAKAKSNINIVGAESSEVELWSTSGRKVVSWENNGTAFPLPELDKGLYILSIRNENKLENIKILIE